MKVSVRFSRGLLIVLPIILMIGLLSTATSVWSQSSSAQNVANASAVDKLDQASSTDRQDAPLRARVHRARRSVPGYENQIGIAGQVVETASWSSSGNPTTRSASPQSVSTSVPEYTREQKVLLDRQDKLPPLIHAQALKQFDGINRKIDELRSRIEPELADQQVCGCCGSNVAPRPPTFDCMKMDESKTPGSLNSWSAYEERPFGEDRKTLNYWNDQWRAAQQRDLQAIKDLERHYLAGTISEPELLSGRSVHINHLVTLENADYRNQYEITVLSIFNLMTVFDEEAGADFGSGDDRLLGLAFLISNRSDRAIDPFYRRLNEMQRNALALANQGQHAELETLNNAIANDTRACATKESDFRDRATPQLRELRARINIEHHEVATWIKSWRDYCISQHAYAGEGSAAIYEIYKDNVPSDPEALAKWLSTLQYYQRLQRVVPTYVVVGLAANCSRSDQGSLIVKYPDIEAAPFSFEISFRTRSIQKGAVPGAAEPGPTGLQSHSAQYDKPSEARLLAKTRTF